jgi:glutamate synthase domain-containing protein 2
LYIGKEQSTAGLKENMTRYFVWQLSIALSVFLGYLIITARDSVEIWILFAISIALTAVGVIDQVQKKRAILRNYPIIGHLRFLLEFIRPEIRQYFLESDNEKLPFSRNQRALVYQRSKNLSDQRPFGTIENVYSNGYEWLSYSNAPLQATIDPNALRVIVGETNCAQPYSISVFNISAMSFGSLSANAVLALNKGAKLGGFAQDTGEGSVSKYHKVHDGDLIWEIGSGYFGCRFADGRFDINQFAKVASDPQIKMIEIKLSQGAKPGHGGILPAAKITPEIAETRGVPMGVDCISPSRHTAFNSPIEMLQFISELRNKSNGKPVGFKLCVGKPEDWFAILKAMIESQLTPDFIVVDGSEGGTGAAPVEFIDHIGMPMRDSLWLIHTTLLGANLRDRIRIGAAGKIISAFDIVRVCAIGADWCNSARGFMFAIGCIQSRTCNTDMCPTGVATQNPLRQRALVPSDKGDRVFHYHHNTLHALSEILMAAGLSHTAELTTDLIMRRDERGIAQPFTKNLMQMEVGALIDQPPERAFSAEDAYLVHAWTKARAEVW